SPLNIPGFVLSTQDQTAPAPTAKIPDFFPTNYCGNAACSPSVSPLNVFRAHYSIGGVSANNGINSGTEAGGDVAGSVMNVQTEKDAGLLGGTFTAWVQ